MDQYVQTPFVPMMYVDVYMDAVYDEIKILIREFSVEGKKNLFKKSGSSRQKDFSQEGVVWSQQIAIGGNKEIILLQLVYLLETSKHGLLTTIISCIPES